MSKKTLLNETQIRRFMKLADLGATQKFKTLREGDVASDRDEDMGMDPEMEAPAPEDEDMAPVGDEGGGMELPPEAVEAVEQAVEAAVDAMGAELERYGVSVDASREGEGDEMDAAPEAPEAPEGEMPDMGGEDDLMEDKQANKGHGPNTKAGKQDRSDVANKASGRWLKEGEDEEELEEAAEGSRVHGDRARKQCEASGGTWAAGRCIPAGEEGLDEVTATGRGYDSGDRRTPRVSEKCYDKNGKVVKCGSKEAVQSEAVDLDDEAVVEEVARRVAARLMKESRAKKRERQIEKLAEKIAKKLNQ